MDVGFFIVRMGVGVVGDSSNRNESLKSQSRDKKLTDSGWSDKSSVKRLRTYGSAKNQSSNALFEEANKHRFIAFPEVVRVARRTVNMFQKQSQKSRAVYNKHSRSSSR